MPSYVRTNYMVLKAELSLRTGKVYPSQIFTYNIQSAKDKNKRYHFVGFLTKDPHISDKN